MIWVVALGFILPIGAIILFGRRVARQASPDHR
jgi:hypothetical protein